MKAGSRRVRLFPARPPALASVRVRLTLWYFAIILLVMLAFGASLYGAETTLNNSAGDAQLEAPLYQAAQQLADRYKPALLSGQPTAPAQAALSPGEVVVLLRPDGTVLDTRGPLTGDAVPQIQASAGGAQAIVSLSLPVLDAAAGQPARRAYRLVLMPILDGNTRVAILAVGLPRESQAHVLVFWLALALGALLVSTIGGYWLAGKAVRPVQQITALANEITATDLRRRLHLRRRDEFGALAATFDQMLARLEAAFKRQSQFTADASHELRTPLTIIDLEINQALADEQPPAAYRQILAQIRDENARMTGIVNSLLLLARADSGQLTLRREAVDLGDLALESVERLLPLAREHGIRLATGALPELVVRGDPQYLSRMLMNLLENAIKYTSGVGSHVEVEVAGAPDGWAVIRVRDDGPGIAAEHLAQLFDRFYRVDKARTRPPGPAPGREEPGGSGLGLAIAQWVAQAHGGTIRVASAPGAGSVFEVRLPLAAPDGTEAQAERGVPDGAVRMTKWARVSSTTRKPRRS